MTADAKPNNYSNYKKLIALADPDWQDAKAGRISELNVKVNNNNFLTDQYDRDLHHFCTTSYLGLDYHPSILNGAIDGLKEAGTLRIANSKNRCKLAVLEQFETELSELFGAHCLSTLSCSAASAGILPLLASGVFTNNTPPIMIFDKLSHYSMNHLKAACADETEVITAPHNDISFIEDLCKKHKKVAYVADGVYSMGGVTDIESLLYLKARYGLFLYLDDSHALSAVGKNGAGFVRPHLSTFDDQTILVASLGKSFAASGGLAMFGSERQKSLVHRYGGPSNWSQSLNSAAIGAGLASIKIHLCEELTALQKELQKNIQLFDSLVETKHKGSFSAIRLVACGEAALATHISRRLADIGFFTSAVFFPVVPQNKAAIRITLRADMPAALIRSFCEHLKDLLKEYGKL